MNAEDKVERILRGVLQEAGRDYVGLWHIAMIVRRELGLTQSDEVRIEVLLIVRGLLERGLCPGDLLQSGFHFWRQKDADAVQARISREWEPGKGDPSLEKPICWFAPYSDRG